MAVRTTYPGVYVQEQQSGSVSISGVATSIALFVGMTETGPLEKATRVLNFTTFGSLFGGGNAAGELPDQVRQFFVNGGGEAFVLRIANGARQAQVTVENEFGDDVFTFTAKNHGMIGETIRFEVDYDTAAPENTFNLTAYREQPGPGGSIVQVEKEQHRELSADPLSPSFVEGVLERDSKLLTAARIPAAFAAARPAGVSFGGLIGTGPADLMAQLQAWAPGAGGGRFEISVDGRPFVPVSIPAPSTVLTVAALNTRLTTVLTPLGVQVVVTAANLGSAARRILQFQSSSTSLQSSVELRSAAGPDDIAVGAQLGSANGGIEVSASSVLRPKPTGIVARLGRKTNATLLEFITELLLEDAANVTDIVISNGSISVPVNFAGVFTGTKLIDDSNPANPPRSLLQGRRNISAMLDTLNAAFNAAPQPRPWRAQAVGYRISLQPEMPGPDVGPTTSISTVGATSFDFGTTGYLGTITGAGGVPSPANVRAYRPGGYGPLFPSSNGITPGSDGAIPQIPEYDKAYAIARNEIDIFNMLVLPRCRSAGVEQTDVARASLWGTASQFCRSERAVLFVDPPTTWRTPDDAERGIQQLRTGLVKDHSAVYWPRVTVTDPLTGATRQIDPAGSVAGVAARIDVSRGVWKANAGLEAAILAVRDVQFRMSDDGNGVINPLAINAIRAFPNGIVVWGARTMDGFDNSGNTDYRYLPVRRLALFLEESLYRGLQFAVFEPNDEPLWAQIRLAAGAFMNGLFRQGAFQGQKASDAYLVKCDAETTTQTDRNLGIVNVLVGFAALHPAEFVILTIRQMAGQVQT